MLSTIQLQDIELLQKECEAAGDFQLKLNWEMLRNRESDHLDFFHYENNELAAYLALYPFGSTVEVCGMVKPQERRKGHFQRLFNQAMETINERPFKKILLNAPASSQEAKSFLKKNGAEYAFSEHQMKWQKGDLQIDDSITLRPAAPEDLALRIQLSVDGFGMSEEDARESETRVEEYDKNTMFMVEADGQPVGKIRLSLEDGEVWIYGFVISADQRGKGIGRKVLSKVIKEESGKGHSIHLEVEAKNDHALGLYTSVGFQALHAQDYYLHQI
ncbi:GNAT family N-acetyltransferase [Falsibacillus albus]|uniref:GNAT family N-acetyltransferase n=1 Tax=Falsibacillus albus TaxID=2478915 RepID=A0A3L7JPZ2_9BACI|nr:GNAT family N-acetyltransferase [Falsibacillus albus]RLQ92394.1 GNAT family N-acetyltransferase [Falsibacillus albus]